MKKSLWDISGAGLSQVTFESKKSTEIGVQQNTSNLSIEINPESIRPKVQDLIMMNVQEK